eukprot:PITA_11651
MASPEKEAHIRPPIFDGSNFTHWKIRTTAYLQSLGAEVWGIVEGGYNFPSAIPTDVAEKKQYEFNAKVVTVLLGSLTQSEFMKVMHFKSAKEMWDKIIPSYEGDDQVKRAKLQTLRIWYENLKMHSNESIANYFLRMDEIVNCIRDLGEEFKEVVLVENVLRSLSAKFDSKVSAIEEKENLQKITMSQLHGILTAFEMRKEGPSEAAFEASGYMSEEEEEVNFVKNLETGNWTIESEDIRSLMAYDKKNAETEEVTKLNEQLETVTRVREKLQDIVKDQSITIHSLESTIFSLKEYLEKSKEQNREALEHEVIKLKKQVEEGRKAEEDLRKQYLEKEEQHQVEVNILKGKLEEKDKLLRFQDSTKILDDILGSQRSPSIKIGLGFYESVEGESSSQGEARNSNEKSEKHNEEMRRKPHQ